MSLEGNIYHKTIGLEVMIESMEHCVKEKIRLNIGGTCFQTFYETLQTFPESKLANLSNLSSYYDDENNEYFFDRNPVLFAFILDSYRKEEIHLPSDICGPTFKKELEFWELSLSHVAPCCWEALYKSEDDIETVNKLLVNYSQNKKMCFMMDHKKTQWRKKLWLFLEDPKSSHLATAWVTLMSILVLISTTAEAMLTIPEWSDEFTDSEKRAIDLLVEMYDRDYHNYTLQRAYTMRPNKYLTLIDVGCHVILTIELVLSFIVCPSKSAFAVNALRFSVILGYIAFWATFGMEYSLSYLNSMPLIIFYLVIKHCTILKLGRLFYLSKHVPAFNVVGLTFSSSKTEFKILLFLLGTLTFSFGYVMFAMECLYNENMNNMFTTMYWAVVTLTTVGYGDIVPNSRTGHVIATVCAVCGVIVLALPIGIIASTFNKFYCFNSYVCKHLKLHVNVLNKLDGRTKEKQLLKTP